MKGAQKVPDQKLKLIVEFEKLTKEYPIVGLVNMENLPAKQLQNMRETLRGEVLIRMTKKRLIRIILKKSEKHGIVELDEHMRGMPALIFTKENPFKLFKKLDKNKSKAPAKAGQIADNDIVVPAGPTPFSPGPVIGELGSLKIKAGVENGKVAIKEAATIVRQGEVIKANVAGLLTRLGIEPMEVGLDLLAVYEDGSIYGKDVLAIDESEYLGNVRAAAAESFSLAVSIAYATSDTIKSLLQKAHSDAIALGKSENILADEFVIELLATAEGQMHGLKNQLNLPETHVPTQNEQPVEAKEAEKPGTKPNETQTREPVDKPESADIQIEPKTQEKDNGNT